LTTARDEAMSILDESQYHHIASQFKLMATEGSPTSSELVDVKPIEDYYELRDKGGPLGKLNIRAFFTLDQSHRRIVVLGLIKKENDGPTHLGDKIRIRIRKRRYEEYSTSTTRSMKRRKGEQS
jgi:hypothetical protein